MFDFVPHTVWILGSELDNQWDGDGTDGLVPMDVLTTSFVENYIPCSDVSDYTSSKKSEDGKTLTWYSRYTTAEAANYQLNLRGRVYRYIAIG